MLKNLRKLRRFISDYTMTNIFNLFVSKNLKKYWLKSNKKNFDELLKKSMEKFINYLPKFIFTTLSLYLS